MNAKAIKGPKVTPVKKLTLREMAAVAGFASVRAFFDEHQTTNVDGELTADPFYFCRVYGEAVRSRVARTQFGDSVYFLGRFKGVLAGGEGITSGKVFLPEYLTTEIEAGLNEAKGSVQFAFDIMLRPRPDLKIGYEFIGESLMDASDPFSAMEGTLGAYALPAPDADGDADTGKGGRKRKPAE